MDGLEYWCAFFLLLFSITGASNILKYSTQFAAETFGSFITVAFAHDGIRPVITFFISHSICKGGCERDQALLYIILLIGTTWIGYELFMTKRSALLNARLREILSDYSLPIAVGIMTFFVWWYFFLWD